MRTGVLVLFDQGLEVANRAVNQRPVILDEGFVFSP
jgi:hypothetical protein